MLNEAGFKSVRVSPRMAYVDSSKPALVEGFTKNTFTAMIEGVRDAALSAGLIDRPTFDKGVRDLYRTAETDGVFCCTFFKHLRKKAHEAYLRRRSRWMRQKNRRPPGGTYGWIP